MRSLLIAASAVFILAASAPAAQAQTFLTPFAGATFGADAPTQKLTYGLSAMFIGPVAGLEVDFGYTPDFFNQNSTTAIISSSNVTTLTGNLVIGAPAGPIRPYGVVGVGLLRSRVGGANDLFTNLTTNDFGLDAGAGVIGLISHNVGLRGDVRYFRSLQNPAGDGFEVALGHFDFWRGTVGVTFRF